MARRMLLVWVCLLGLSAPSARLGFCDEKPQSTGPKIVLIIRHGEKPDTESSDLSPRGFERAAALAKVIPADFPRPDFLFATHRSKKSDRPVETITPLSHTLGEPIVAEFADDEFAKLAHQILGDPRYSGKIVLIAWHHGKIPELAKALGAAEIPEKWDNAVFDRVWKIEYHDGHAEFADLPQHALPGDSAK